MSVGRKAEPLARIVEKNSKAPKNLPSDEPRDLEAASTHGIVSVAN